MFAARSHSHREPHSPGAGAGALGDLRSLHRCHTGLPGCRPRRRCGTDRIASRRRCTPSSGRSARCCSICRSRSVWRACAPAMAAATASKTQGRAFLRTGARALSGARRRGAAARAGASMPRPSRTSAHGGRARRFIGSALGHSRHGAGFKRRIALARATDRAAATRAASRALPIRIADP